MKCPASSILQEYKSNIISWVKKDLHSLLVYSVLYYVHKILYTLKLWDGNTWNTAALGLYAELLWNFDEKHSYMGSEALMSLIHSSFSI